MHFETLRRSIIGIGNDRNMNQVHSMEMNAMNANSGSGIQCELGSFEHQVFRRFRVLSGSSDEEILSLNWVSKLLEAFIGCLDDFKVVMSENGPNLSKPPLHRFVTELFDVIIKALDICNAVCDGVEKIRLWNKHLDIVSTAFDSKSRNVMVEGQFRRAKKGLADLAMIMLDNNNSNNNQSSSVFAYRNCSSVGLNKGKDSTNNQKAGHAKSMSWIIPNSWSASKQLQLIANGLVPPRGHEISTTNGLANIVYTMGFVLMFVLWALVAAVPCQDRTFQVQFSVPRQFSWGTPLSLLHTRIVDESKKRERKNNIGLLKEIQRMETSIHLVTDLVDSVNPFPLTEEQKEEVKAGVKQVSQVCEVFKNGLGPLERQLREVFHMIMSCRTDGLEVMGQAQC